MTAGARNEPKVVVVTGASAGIGRAAARRFGAQGASVATVIIPSDLQEEKYEAPEREYARCLRFSGRMRGSLSGTLATMGPGVPYAIGAKFACPDRPVIALVGDGAMGRCR